MPTELAAQRTSREAKLAAWSAARALFDDEAGALAARVAAGEITPREFEARLQQEVKDLYVSAYVAGRSGQWDDITPAQWGRLGPLLRVQYGFARRFSRDIEALPVGKRSEAVIRARAQLYGASSRQVLERGILDELSQGGRPVPELPAYPGDGTTDCYTNCRCRWAVRILSKARGDYDVSWRLGRAEHCRQCRKRSRAWKALRVRGGVLEDGYAAEGTFR